MAPEASVSGRVGLSLGLLQCLGDMIAGFFRMSEAVDQGGNYNVIYEVASEVTYLHSAISCFIRVSYEQWPTLKGRVIELQL